jgi:hypothetical protein
VTSRGRRVDEFPAHARVSNSSPSSSSTPVGPPDGTNAAEPQQLGQPQRTQPVTTAAEQPVPRAPLTNEPGRPVGKATPHRATGVATTAGGLLFLLNALDRIGYGEWLHGNDAWTDQDLARRLLRRALLRLRVPEDDPAWSVVSHLSDSEAPLRFDAPALWRADSPLPLARQGSARIRLHAGGGGLYDATGRLLLTAWQDEAGASDGRDHREPAGSRESPLVAHVVDAWGIALGRWLRKVARIGVASIVLRPARIDVSPTHVDTLLDLAQADLRVRRAGLDLDPGWLPWFGRVVTFQYDGGR